MASKSSDMMDHPLVEKEIEERAKSDTPHFKLFVKPELKGTLKKSKPTGESPQVLYFHTESNGLHFPPKKVNGNISVIMVLKKSEQHGYFISNCVLQDTYLKVTEEALKSRRLVKFTDSKKIEIKLRKDPRSETKFALYMSAPDSKGHNKIYYLTPKSGAIMAEESSSPDGYYHFSMSKATLPGNSKQQSTPISHPPTQPIQPVQDNSQSENILPEEPHILHNLASFKKRAQSKSPLFWLRKHPKHPVSAGGYFYADKDLTNWYFDPERFDDKDWPSDEKAVLRAVYHKEKETEEGYYITIESALIPDRYLAINLEQPTQEGSDTYYPVQFTSKEKVKWYRGHDMGETFSLYTYIKEGAEYTKFYCSLVSELRHVEQVFATAREENRMILDFGVPKPLPRVGRPLTINELRQEISTEYYTQVAVIFPEQENQTAYVSTSIDTLQFKHMSTPHLSAIMLLKRVDNEDGTTRGYIWSSRVTPYNYYLTVDVNSPEPPYLVTFNPTMLSGAPPLWTVHEGSDGQLGFAQTINEMTYYLKPVVVPIPFQSESNRELLPFFPTNGIPIVNAVATPQYPINIFPIYDPFPPALTKM